MAIHDATLKKPRIPRSRFDAAYKEALQELLTDIFKEKPFLLDAADAERCGKYVGRIVYRSHTRPRKDASS